MNEQDIRVVKTKKAIHDALFTVLEEKPINKITIKEIADIAQVNRKTIYTHYTCIEDIVDEIENEMVTNIEAYLQSCMIEEYGLNPYSFMQFIDSVYSSNPIFCESLVSIRNYHFFAEKIKHLLKNQILKSLNVPEDRKLFISLQAEFFISGATAVYIEWIKKGKPCSFEEISDMLLNNFTDGIAKMPSPL